MRCFKEDGPVLFQVDRKAGLAGDATEKIDQVIRVEFRCDLFLVIGDRNGTCGGSVGISACGNFKEAGLEIQ